MKTTLRNTPLIALLCLLLASCTEDHQVLELRNYTDTELAILQQELQIDNQPIDYQLQFPEHMISMGLRPPVVNNQKAFLGRVLFYDTRLSANNAVSCASCHHQDLAFADGHAFSKGFQGELTKRNSLALATVADFQTSYDGNGGGETVSFFWDERARSIHEQSIQTIQDPIEMGMDLNQLSARLNEVPMYNILARKAFGEPKLDGDQIALALQEFCNSLSSTNSPFDEHLNWRARGARGSSPLTQRELAGLELFSLNCAACHSHDMTFSVINVSNNGLDLDYTDKGVGAITGNSADDALFKVPMLRNITVTAPYMHDGRFQTLEEVLDHYNTGLVDHPNLPVMLRQAGDDSAPIRNFLTQEDKADLLAFLHTLTDEKLLTDERFSDPFKR